VRSRLPTSRIQIESAPLSLMRPSGDGGVWWLLKKLQRGPSKRTLAEAARRDAEYNKWKEEREAQEKEAAALGSPIEVDDCLQDGGGRRKSNEGVPLHVPIAHFLQVFEDALDDPMALKQTAKEEKEKSKKKFRPSIKLGKANKEKKARKKAKEESEMTLGEALEDAKEAVDMFLNNSFEEAKDIVQPM